MTKLKARMEQLGYGTVEVAKGAHIDRWDLNDYLYGRLPIPGVRLARLARFLACEPEDIYDRFTGRIRIDGNHRRKPWRGESPTP